MYIKVESLAKLVLHRWYQPGLGFSVFLFLNKKEEKKKAGVQMLMYV